MVVNMLSGIVVVVGKVNSFDESECEPQAVKNKEISIRKKVLVETHIFNRGIVV